MSLKNAKRIRTVYGIILSLLLITVGLLFILSCIDIYQSGDRPFSTESIGAHFQAIALPFYLCIIWAVGGVLTLILPQEHIKQKGNIPPAVTLARLSKKLDMDRCPEALAKSIRLQRRLRAVFSGITAVLYLAGTVRSLLYALNKNNFPAAEGQFNAEILRGTLQIVLYLAPPFLYSIVVSFIHHASRKREIVLTKEAIAQRLTSSEQGQTTDHATDSCSRTCPIKRASAFFTKHKRVAITVVRCAVLAIGVLFVLLGIVNGGMNDVVQKAIKICTECIGLG